MATTRSLADLRIAVRQRADMVNNEFVTDTELDSYINQSLFELYDLLVQKYGEHYFLTTPPYQFTTDGSDMYALPADFYKGVGVDLMVGTGSSGWMTLRPFNFAERNRYLFPGVQSAAGLMSNMRYRYTGSKLWLTPTPAAGQTLRLWYVPRMQELVDSSSVTLSMNPIKGDRLTATCENGAVFNFIFTGTHGLTAGASDGTSYAGATSMETTGVEFLYAGGGSVLLSPADNSAAPQTFTYTSFSANTLHGISPAVPAWGTGHDGVVVANPIVDAASVSVASADGATIVALLQSALINAGFAATVDLGTGLVAFAGAAASATWQLLQAGHDPQTATATSGVFDGISGWDEYVVVDAAIKCLAKEETDASVLLGAKAALIQRIESAACNRDAGSPATISDANVGTGYSGEGWNWPGY